jgi:hypothetical protein
MRAVLPSRYLAVALTTFGISCWSDSRGRGEPKIVRILRDCVTKRTMSYYVIH